MIKDGIYYENEEQYEEYSAIANRRGISLKEMMSQAQRKVFRQVFLGGNEQ